MFPTMQRALSAVTTVFFAPTSFTVLLDSSGAGSFAVVSLLHERGAHTHQQGQIVRLSYALSQTTPKSAHRILQEWLAHLAPDTNTNGHTYQGLLQILGRRLGTNPHKYHGLILEMPPCVTDTAELATALADLKSIQRTHPGLSVLVTATPRHSLPPELFTAVVTIPEPSPAELKLVARSVIPAVSEEIAALIVAYTCKLHTSTLTQTDNLIDTVTELTTATAGANNDDELSSQTVIKAFHAHIGRTVVNNLTADLKIKGWRKSGIYLPGLVAAAIATHDSMLRENPRAHSAENTVWLSCQAIYRHLINLTHARRVRGNSYLLVTKAIPNLITAGCLIAHPANNSLVALNPILADTRIIPHILNPQETPTADARSLSHKKAPSAPKRVSHIALLAALVKTEQTAHPSVFPTHRHIYPTYLELCAKFDTTPRPLRTIYRSIQSLRKNGFIHVHRAYNKQGRPNQLLHQLSPNDTNQLRAQTYAMTYPKFITNEELLSFNSYMNTIIASLKSTHKRDILTTIASIAARSKRNLFNASNVYAIYTRTTTKPIPKHTFLTAIRNLIKDKILTPLYRAADLSLTITLTLPIDLRLTNKPPP